MPEEFKPGCQRPKSSTAEAVPAEKAAGKTDEPMEVKTMIKVGKKAPDFTAAAFHKGKFVNVKLSEYTGKWVVLCFYPGDFTFV